LGAIALIVAAVLFFGGGAVLDKRIPIVSFFQGSVAGLQVGAAVTFRGVQVGKVTSLGIRFNPDTYGSVVQVNMNLLPDTVAIFGTRLPYDDKLVSTLVARGLTAKLVKQSFVTGLSNVELDFRPDVKAWRLGEPAAAAEVPSVPTDIYTLAKRVENIDIAAVFESAQQTLASLNEFLTRPELTQSVKELPAVVSQLRQTLKTVDGEVAALSQVSRGAIGDSASALQKTLASVQTLAANLDREVTSTLTAARGTVEGADTAIDRANTLLDPRGRTAIQVQRAVDDLAATAARLRNVAERVDRDPSILVRGR
jgi:paraquat-inducible protein B